MQTFISEESETEYTMMSNDIISEHPLKWQTQTALRLAKYDPSGYHISVLISWQPISEEDYKLYQQSFADNAGYRTSLKTLKGFD